MSTVSNSELLTGLGAAVSIFLTSAGAAVASVPAGKYAMKFNNGYLSFTPIIIAGVLALYGIIVSVLLAYKMQSAMDAVSGYKNISAGLSVGLACLVSGMGMACFIDDALADKSDADVAAAAGGQEEPLIGVSPGRCRYPNKQFIRFLFVMVFLEAIGLYGLIVALVLVS